MKNDVPGHEMCKPLPVQEFDAHVNVEICSSIKFCKYLYVYKCLDMVSVEIHVKNSESHNATTDKCGTPRKEPDEIKVC